MVKMRGIRGTRTLTISHSLFVLHMLRYVCRREEAPDVTIKQSNELVAQEDGYEAVPGTKIHSAPVHRLKSCKIPPETSCSRL